MAVEQVEHLSHTEFDVRGPVVIVGRRVYTYWQELAQCWELEIVRQLTSSRTYGTAQPQPQPHIDLVLSIYQK